MGWFKKRHEGYEPGSRSDLDVTPIDRVNHGFEIDNTTTHYMPASAVIPPDERSYNITMGIGSFGSVDIPWRGTSREDVELSFLEFLHNPEFADLPEYPHLRLVKCRFNGLNVAVRFRTDWMSAYSVSPPR